MHHLNNSHRLFKCTICGNIKPFVNNPKLDGCFGELHKTQSGDMSGLSMMSDPIFTGYQRRRR